MLILTNTTDKLQMILGTAADVDTHVSGTDMPTPITPTSNATPFRDLQSRTTAATHDLCPVPAASTVRNVKTIHIFNKDSADSTDVTIIYDANGTDYTLHKCNLAPGEALEYVEGIGWFEIAASPAVQVGTNKSTAAQGAGFASDTYLTGSSIPLAALGAPQIGYMYDCSFEVSKTGAGTATPIIIVRVGTAGTTADTARLTFTFNAGTANADIGVFTIRALFRAVGGSAIMQGRANLVKGATATTGLVNLVGQTLQVTSGTFDSTVANSIIGVSVNGGTSASWTVQLVEAEIVKR